jgi:hypothetical protein
MLVDLKESSTWDKIDCMMLQVLLNQAQKQIEERMLSKDTTSSSVFTKLCSNKEEVKKLKENLYYTVWLDLEDRLEERGQLSLGDVNIRSWEEYTASRKLGCLNL